MVTFTMELSVDNHHKATWLSDKLTILVTSHESCVVNYGKWGGEMSGKGQHGTILVGVRAATVKYVPLVTQFWFLFIFAFVRLWHTSRLSPVFQSLDSLGARPNR